VSTTPQAAADAALAWALWNVEDDGSARPLVGAEHLARARAIRRALAVRGHVIVNQLTEDAQQVTVALTVPGGCRLRLLINGEELLLPD
jgi:hypothetical protein